LAFFGVNFILQKIWLCKKNDKYEVWYEVLTANLKSEVKFVTAGGGENFFASGVNFSIFTHFLCFFLLKLLKLGEIDVVKFLAWKSGGVNFLTNSMSVWSKLRFYFMSGITLDIVVVFLWRTSYWSIEDKTYKKVERNPF